MPSRPNTTRRGFSLLELMIAIVILGLGLVMVATTYPVGWQRARRLGEYTRQLAVTEAAHTTVQMLAKVDGYTDKPDGGSFAGDQFHDSFDGPDGRLLFVPDSRVHLLYMENVLADAPRAIYPNRDDPRMSDDWSPWELARLGIMNPYIKPNLPDSLFDSGFGAAQVRLESRVYPALPPRKEVTRDGVFDDDDPLWDEAFENTRFAWCAFHKLVDPDKATLDPITNQSAINIEALQGERTFQMYYVTLRRGRPGSRYARQDITPDALPNPLNRADEVEPAALTAEHDVLIPSPWRVQVRFPDELAWRDDPGAPVQPTGLPTEIEVARGPGNVASWLVNIFQDDTQMIDEDNGFIYRVTRVRLAGDDLDEAFLTLSREYYVEDLDDVEPFGALVADEETLRTVWVFPPAVEAGRLDDDIPVFVGGQPVVSIEKRMLTIRP